MNPKTRLTSIKILGFAALAALAAMTFLGAPVAMAESTELCKIAETPCAAGNAVTHIHEETLTGSKAKLLAGATGTVECDALFLGDSLGLGEPTIIHGHFTYTNCKLGGTSCTVTEVSIDTLLEVLRLGHETADVNGEGETNFHCGFFINCTYNGSGVKATAKGPLLATFENGEVTLSEQTLNKVSGICPSTSKLDINTMPLGKVYLGGGKGGEEGVAKVDLTPNSAKFKFTEWQLFTVKNTGTKSLELVSISIAIQHGTASAFTGEENKCAAYSSKKLFKPGESCTVKIVCNEWEADASVEVSTIPFASDLSHVNSLP